MTTALSDLESETRYFWKIVNEGITLRSLTEYQDEIEALGIVTESRALKRACIVAMHRFDHLGTIKRVAGGAR